METKPNNKKTTDERLYDSDSYPNISNTVSSNECTGMMYSPPQNDEETESYEETFSMQTPKKKEKPGL